MKTYTVTMHGPQTGMRFVEKQIEAKNLREAKRFAQEMGGAVQVDPYTEFEPHVADQVRAAIGRLSREGKQPYGVPDEISVDADGAYVLVPCEEVAGGYVRVGVKLSK